MLLRTSITVTVLLCAVILLISCNKDDGITNPITTGSLAIFSSSAHDASYFIDSLHLHGTTPDTLTNIPAGTYEVRLELDGYYPDTGMATVVAGKLITYSVTMHQGRGAVQFNSVPDSAAVIIFHNIIRGYTPCLLTEMFAGPVMIELKKPGYIVWDSTINILVSDTVIINVKLDSLLGWLDITSMPTGASVYVADDLSQHATPYLDSLSPGTYTVRAEMPGYYPQQTNVTVSVLDTTAVQFNMVLITGTLKLTSQPSNVLVFVNSLSTGQTTPLSLQLTPGSHLIGLRESGYHDLDTNLTITAEQTISVNFLLQPFPATLTVSANLSGAAIEINGVPTGYTTPHTFDSLAPGTYRIRLTRPEYFAVDTTLAVDPGTDNFLRAEFLQAPAIRFAFTVGDTIFVASADGIITDTLSTVYDDWLEGSNGYGIYQGEIRWSPDGRYLAFTGDEYMVSIVGSDGVWLRGFDGNRSMDFTWSPNSAELVWGVYGYGLYKNVISTNWYGLITVGNYCNTPAYSPDGSQIIFMYHNWGWNCRIDLCNADGSNRHTIYGWFSDGYDEHNQLAWSTDTSAIFKIDAFGLYEVNIPDSGSTILTKRISGNITRLRLSAGRQWAAYMSPTGIYRTAIDIWDQYRLTDLDCYDFAITPHGEYVLCRTADGVHLVDYEGLAYHIIVNKNAGRGAIDLKP